MKKNSQKTTLLTVFCGCAVALAASAQTPIEGFEYANEEDMLAQWAPQGATLTLSSYVAARASGTNSLRIERTFPATTWETEVVSGPSLDTPLVIEPDQFVTLRVAGDPQFTNASFQTLYLYAFDSNGNKGRWGSPVPTSTTNWEVLNFKASTAEKPWDSTDPVNLSDIVQFKLYIYGQGDPPGTEFSATIYVDDIIVRDSALVEFPPASPLRSLIDNFEGHVDDAALMTAYTYVSSPAATVTTACLASPAPEGSKALKLAIDFAGGQWPCGSVRSGIVTPFSFPTNAVVQFSLKGDPAMASISDAGTVFWLTFYDQGGRAFTFSDVSAPLSSSEWTTVKATYNQFWFGTPVDTGNLVQWRLLVEGWEGTADSTPRSGTFYVDNVRITIPPTLSIMDTTLKMSDLIPGTTYTILQTSNLAEWTTATTIQATGTTATWTIPAGQLGFYRVYYTP